jgi:hypothetical protein
LADAEEVDNGVTQGSRLFEPRDDACADIQWA